MAFDPTLCDGFDNYTVLQERWTLGGAFTASSAQSRHSWGQGVRVAGAAIEIPPVTNFLWEGAVKLAQKSFPPFGRQADLSIGKHSTPVSTLIHVALHMSDTFHPFITNVSTGAVIAGPTTGPEFVIELGVWYWWQLRVVIHATTGSVDFRINDNQWLQATNVNTVHSSADPGEALVDYFQMGGSPGNEWDIDDFVWQDGANGDFQGDMLVIGKRPVAAGYLTQFDVVGAASNYLAVDEVTADEDTTHVASETVGERDSYIIDDITEVPDSSIVLAVQQAFRHEKTEPGPRTVTGFIRVDPDEHLGEQRFPSQDDYLTSIEQPFTVQPDLVSDWGTVGDFNALDVEIGQEVGS